MGRILFIPVFRLTQEISSSPPFDGGEDVGVRRWPCEQLLNHFASPAAMFFKTGELRITKPRTFSIRAICAPLPSVRVSVCCIRRPFRKMVRVLVELVVD